MAIVANASNTRKVKEGIKFKKNYERYNVKVFKFARAKCLRYVLNRKNINVLYSLNYAVLNNVYINLYKQRF